MASPLTSLNFQGIGADGLALPGGLLYSYAAGTLTPQATFTDSTGSVPNANPVVLDAAGQKPIWLGNSAYRFILRNAAGVLVRDADNVTSAGGLEAGVYSTFADAASAANGAGRVGFAVNPTTYAAGTAGWELQHTPGGRNVLHYIPAAEWAGILARTSTYDCTSALNAAFAAEKHVFIPRGRFRTTSRLIVPRACSISASAGANIYCDGAVPSTWGGIFRGMEIHGDGNVDPDTHTRFIENLVFTFNNATASAFTGVYIPNGATGPSVGESVYQLTMRNIMVDGCDTAYHFGQLWESHLFGLKARNIRVGVVIVGKCVGLYFYGLNLYGGAPVTPSGDASIQLLIDSYNVGGANRGGGVEERPEGLHFVNPTIVETGAGGTVADIRRALVCRIDQGILDAGAGSFVIRVGDMDGLRIRDTWFASGTQKLATGLKLDPISNPDVASPVLVDGCQFHDCHTGIAATGRARLQIVNNTFQGTATGADISLQDCRVSAVTGNRSHRSTKRMIDVIGCPEIVIDDNNTEAGEVLYLHPTISSVQAKIGKNTGTVQRTHQRGSTVIAAGATSASLSITTTWPNTLGVYPKIKIVGTDKNVGFVNVLDAGLGTYTLSIAAVAPAGGVTVRWEAEALWQGDAA